jgi:hypothetical protein
MDNNIKSGLPPRTDKVKLKADLDGVLKEINESLQVNRFDPRPPAKR